MFGLSANLIHQGREFWFEVDFEVEQKIINDSALNEWAINWHLHMNRFSTGAPHMIRLSVGAAGTSREPFHKTKDKQTTCRSSRQTITIPTRVRNEME